ncbi:PAS domain-containing protein [Colwellia psychrerythraea]|nr:PAS domain-containing protein [Colwellia psychrerythraea]
MAKRMLIENALDFIKNSNIGIHAVSPEGIIKYANEHELNVLGYTEEEYVGHHVSEFQFDKSCLEQMMNKLAKFESFSNFPAMVNGKHEMKYILYNSSVYESQGEFIHTRCFGNEISESVYNACKLEYKKSLANRG